MNRIVPSALCLCAASFGCGGQPSASPPAAVSVAAVRPGAAEAADKPTADPGPPDRPILLKPARVFDGVAAEPHEGYVVLVRGERIEEVGPADKVKAPD